VTTTKNGILSLPERTQTIDRLKELYGLKRGEMPTDPTTGKYVKITNVPRNDWTSQICQSVHSEELSLEH